MYFRELVIVGERLLAFTELTEGTNTSYGEYQSTIYVVVVRRVYCSGFISTTCCLDTLTGQVRVRQRHHGSSGQADLIRYECRASGIGFTDPSVVLCARTWF